MSGYAERIMSGGGRAPVARGTHDRVHSPRAYANGEAMGEGAAYRDEIGVGFGDAEGAGTRHGEGTG